MGVILRPKFRAQVIFHARQNSLKGSVSGKSMLPIPDIYFQTLIGTRPLI